MEAKFEILSQPAAGKIEIKRFYAIKGTVIRFTCPECGDTFERELEGDDVSYPDVNQPYEYHVSHYKEWRNEDGEWDSFEHDFSVLLYLKLQVLPYVEGMENE